MLAFQICVYCGKPTAEEMNVSIQDNFGIGRIIHVSRTSVIGNKYFYCSFCGSAYIVVLDGYEAKNSKYIFNNIILPDWIYSQYNSLRSNFNLFPEFIKDFILEFEITKVIIPLKKGIRKIPKKQKGRLLIVGMLSGIEVGMSLKNIKGRATLTGIRRMGYI